MSTSIRDWPKERPQISPLLLDCRPVPRDAAVNGLRSLEGQRWAVLDFETAAFHEPRVVEVGLVDRDGKVLVEGLVDPGIPMEKRVIELHGLRDEDVADQRRWPELQEELARALEQVDVVVAFSARFESMCLDYNARLWGLQPLRPTFVCAQELAIGFVGLNEEKNWLSLRSACSRLGLAQERSHRAVDDCIATVKVIEQLQRVAQERR